jgi:hypothetical protein
MCKINCSGGCPDCSPEDHPKPHKHAALIKAWADGAIIEYKKGSNSWNVVGAPLWAVNTEYRIKPEPMPDLILYARASCHFEKANTYWSVSKSGEDNIKAVFDGETGKIKSVEIIK